MTNKTKIESMEDTMGIMVLHKERAEYLEKIILRISQYLRRREIQYPKDNTNNAGNSLIKMISRIMKQ